MESTKREKLDIREDVPAILKVGEEAPEYKPPTSRPNITKVERSSVLSRVEAFLPQMKKANDALEEKMKHEPREKFDIEHVEGDEEKVIEMDIGMGVLEGQEEVNEDNIKIPGQTPVDMDVENEGNSDKKPLIQVLDDSN